MKKLLITLVTISISSQSIALTYESKCDSSEYIAGSMAQHTCRTDQALLNTEVNNYHSPTNFNFFLKKGFSYALNFFSFGTAGKFFDDVTPSNNEGTITDIVSYKIAKEWIKQAGIEIEKSGESITELINNLKIVEKASEFTETYKLNPQTQKDISIAIIQLLSKIIIKNSEHEYQINTELYESIEEIELTQDNLKTLKDSIPSEEKIIEYINKNIDQKIEQSFTSFLLKNEESLSITQEIELYRDQLKKDPNNETVKKKLEHAKQELSSNKKELLKQFNHNLFFKELEAANLSINFASSLLSFTSPELGHHIQKAGTSIILAVKSMDALVTSSSGSMASLAAYSALAASGLQIFSLLKKPQKTNEQIIIEQIAKLSEQLEDIRTQMHERFNHLEDMLITVYNGVIENFIILHKQNNRIERYVLLSQRTINYINTKVDLLNSKINTLAKELYNSDYNTYINNCITSQEIFSDWEVHLPQEVYRQCILDISKWVLKDSTSPILTGLHTEISNPIQVETELNLSEDNYSYSIQILFNWAKENGYLNYYTTLPNPIAWYQGMSSYLTIREQNSIYDEITDTAGDQIQQMKLQGEALLMFHHSLLTSKDLFNDLLNKYQIELKNFLDHFEDLIAHHLNESYFGPIRVSAQKSLNESKKVIDELELQKDLLRSQSTDLKKRFNELSKKLEHLNSQAPGIRSERELIEREYKEAKEEYYRKKIEIHNIEKDINQHTIIINSSTATINKFSFKNSYELLSFITRSLNVTERVRIRENNDSEDTYSDHKKRHKAYLDAYQKALNEVEYEDNRIDLYTQLIRGYSYFAINRSYFNDPLVRIRLFDQESGLKTRTKLLQLLANNHPQFGVMNQIIDYPLVEYTVSKYIKRDLLSIINSADPEFEQYIDIETMLSRINQYK